MPDVRSLDALPPLLTIPAAAWWLGVSRRTVYRMIDDGSLERVKIRGAARIPRESLTLYLKSTRRSPGPEKGGDHAS